MKNILSIIFLIIQIETAFGQYKCQCPSGQSTEKYLDETLFGKAYYPAHFINDDLQYFDNWAKGVVILENGGQVKSELLRYNGFTDELIWMRRSDHNLAVIDKQSIKAFELHDQQNMLKDYFKKIKIKNWYSGDSTEVYMHILAEGSLSLYVFRQVAANSNTNTLYLKPGYYLGMNSQYYKFSPNRWTLFYLIKDEEQRSRMKSVVRSNHLKIREENDLIRAIELYNKSLLSSK